MTHEYDTATRFWHKYDCATLYDTSMTPSHVSTKSTTLPHTMAHEYDTATRFWHKYERATLYDTSTMPHTLQQRVQ
jgi:hypothetical protein